MATLAPADTLTGIGGEFADRSTEAAFRAETLPETLRNLRLLLIASAVLNTLFLFSDWRFEGTPHFFAAVGARTATILLALAGLVALVTAKTDRYVERIALGWMWGTAAAVSVLVSSHSEIALFVVLMLPMIYWLVVPVSFAARAASGIGCSVLMLTGFMWDGSQADIALGLVLVVLMFNVALVLLVRQNNRLLRLSAKANHALAASRNVLETIFRACPVPLTVNAMSDGRLLYVNDMARRFLASAGGGDGFQTVPSMRDLIMDPLDLDRMYEMILRDGRVDRYELFARRPGKSGRHLMLSAVKVDVDGVPAVMTGVFDITERKRLEADLERLANTDTLTGLPNRNRLFAQAERILDQLRASKKPLCTMLIDVNGMAALNGAHGHATGDAALAAIGRVIADQLPPGGSAARLSGDGFVMLLADCGIAEARDIADTFRATVADLALPGGARVTVSVGLAALRADDASIGDPLVRAEQALRQAKALGPDRVAEAPAAA
jgi:diguanylate cyclase (GGDEF)-like protein